MPRRRILKRMGGQQEFYDRLMLYDYKDDLVSFDTSDITENPFTRVPITRAFREKPIPFASQRQME